MNQVVPLSDEEFERLVAAFRNRDAPPPSTAHLNDDQRALIAASVVTTVTGRIKKHYPDAISVEEASVLVNADLWSVRQARTLMRQGPQHIPDIKRGIRTLGSVFERLRPRSQRRPATADTGADFFEVEVWKQFRDAILLITGLPQAQDVVRIARLRDKSDVSTTRLNKAIKWLKEFEHEWGSRDANTEGH